MNPEDQRASIPSTRRRRRIGWLILAFVLAALPARADSLTFVETLSSQALATLATSDDEARRDAAGRLLARAIDLAELARSTAGTAWESASDAERAEFQRLLTDVLVGAMARDGEIYRVVRFAVTGSRPGQDGAEIVGSEASRPGYVPIAVDWHVHADADGYRIDDLVFAGLSARVLLRTAAVTIAAENGGGLAGLNLGLRRMADDPIALPSP